MATTSSTTSTSAETWPADESVPGGRASSTGHAAHEAERRLVGFVLDLVEAPDGATGAVAGSNLDAATRIVLAARDARPDVRRPSLVVPDTVDPVYLRAAHLLGVRPVVVPTDAAGRAQVGPMAHAMDEQAVLAVVSAPSPALGVVDPVTWIGTAAVAKSVPLHVDACAGGWLLACAERLGRVGPAWTFAAPGVGSVSLDLPLDGGTTSVLLHRSAVADPFPVPPGPGRPAAPGPTASVAAAWRQVADRGLDGHLVLAGSVLRAVEVVAAAVADTAGLRLATEPDAAVLLLGVEEDGDPFTLAEQLTLRGWYAEAQPTWRDGPPTVRLALDAAAAADPDQLVTALRAAVRAARAQGPVALPTRVRDHLSRLDPGRLSVHDTTVLLDALGLDAGTAAGDARFEALLGTAAPALRAALVARLTELRRTPVRAGPGHAPA